MGDVQRGVASFDGFRTRSVCGYQTVLVECRLQSRGNALPSSLILTIIGADRPGLVEALSETVAAHGANWVESRMSHLAGQFAGLLRVTVEQNRVDPLAEALRSLSAEGLDVIVATSEQLEVREFRSLSLELLGQDRPGIVRDISRALAERRVNVEDLETRCTSAPMSGEVLFTASARLRIPLDTATEELREALEKIGHELMVDVTLDDAD
jgi:glycine cleavage system regulatory protein